MIKARIPAGLLTSERLSPLPVMRGAEAVATVAGYLRTVRVFDLPFAEVANRTTWVVHRTPRGKQYICLQPDEAIEALRASGRL